MSKVKAAWGQVEIVPNIGNMRNRDGEHWETPEQPIAGLRQVGGVGAVRAGVLCMVPRVDGCRHTGTGTRPGWQRSRSSSGLAVTAGLPRHQLSKPFLSHNTALALLVNKGG